MYHGFNFNHTQVSEENEVLQMSAIKSDLYNCMLTLNAKEADLSDKIAVLTTEAKRRQDLKDRSGAKRKLIERRRCNEQLQRVTNSICIMDSHMSALEGTELNKSILNTIRASGDAIKRLSVKVRTNPPFYCLLRGIHWYSSSSNPLFARLNQGGISTVEDIISEVEAQMENAADITKIISSGNVSGSINSMSGIEFSEQELEAELAELLEDPDEQNVSSTGVPMLRKTSAARIVESVPTIDTIATPSTTHVHDTRESIREYA
jgi:hypothetical protein